MESTLWKPGESSYPAGRPKGSRNIRTILDEMLHRYVDVEALKHLKGINATVELCKQLCDAKNDTRQDGDLKERARLDSRLHAGRRVCRVSLGHCWG